MLALLLSLVPGARAGDLEVDPYVLVQSWVTVYDMDVSAQSDPAGYGDPEDDIGFKMRRARAGLEGTYDRLDFEVIFGVSTGADAVVGGDHSVGLVDANAGYTFGDPEGLSTRVSAGVDKVPFGRETLLSSSELAFQERTVASNQLTPDREAGLIGDLQTSGLRARVGVFNGNGSVFGDTDPGLLTTARVEYTLGPGDPYRTYGTVDGFTLGVAGDFLYNGEFATRTMGYGGDLIVRVAALSLLVEGHAASITPTGSDIELPDVSVDTMRWGGYAQVGYSIGRWEPVARFEMFDDDTKVSDNGDLAAGTFGVTAHLMEDHLRLGGGYVLRLERGGAGLPNDTARLWGQVRF